MNNKRAYDMSTRAESAMATRARILGAASTLLRERLRTDIRIEDVAAAAEVSEMTILRAFGTKSGLMEAALEHTRGQIVAQRQEPAPGDIAGSVTAVVDHYEQHGDLVINNLAEERSDPAIGKLVALGRRDHRRWVERQFGPQLAGRSHAERAQLIDALIVACDVYTWKRLRRDSRRNRRQVIDVMRRLVEGVLGESFAEPV